VAICERHLYQTRTACAPRNITPNYLLTKKLEEECHLLFEATSENKKRETEATQKKKHSRLLQNNLNIDFEFRSRSFSSKLKAALVDQRNKLGTSNNICCLAKPAR
jgi:hypothetical protein